MSSSIRAILTDNYFLNLSERDKVSLDDKIRSLKLADKEEFLKKFNIWISNFIDKNEKDLALKVFYEMTHYGRDAYIQELEKRLNSLKVYIERINQNFDDVCLVVPDQNADSAHMHAYELSKEWEVGLRDIVNVSEVKNISKNKNKLFVFFNDTHGSGKQFLSEFSGVIDEVGQERCFVICICITKIAINRIREEYSTIKIIPEEYTKTIKDKMSHEECNKLREIGEHVYPKHPLGFGNIGLLVSYYYQCPNNTLPIIWANGKNNSYVCKETGNKKGGTWKPLFEYRKKHNKKSRSELNSGYKEAMPSEKRKVSQIGNTHSDLESCQDIFGQPEDHHRNYNSSEVRGFYDLILRSTNRIEGFSSINELVSKIISCNTSENFLIESLPGNGRSILMEGLFYLIKGNSEKNTIYIDLAKAERDCIKSSKKTVLDILRRKLKRFDKEFKGNDFIVFIDSVDSYNVIVESLYDDIVCFLGGVNVNYVVGSRSYSGKKVEVLSPIDFSYKIILDGIRYSDLGVEEKNSLLGIIIVIWKA